MDKLKYKIWTWPENPETFLISAVAHPQYTVEEDGTIVYKELGPVCRTITGSGVFRGENANNYFNALAVIMATRTVGELVHPKWGTIQAYLTGLKMEEGSREDFIIYSFTFREADASGKIPVLPEYM